MEQIKNIQVSADVASGGAAKRRTRKRTSGGGSTSAGTIDQLGASSAPGWSSADALPKMDAVGAPLGVAFLGAGANSCASGESLAGGRRVAPTKVVLTKKHKSKVILGKPTVTRLAATVPVATRNKTRKTKRINISLSGLTNKMTRANKIKKESKRMDIAVIKKVLVKAGLVKDTTKAPEGILRQMYEDYATIKNRAL
jgi:hypothetical protein